jgi:hypothetical protein
LFQGPLNQHTTSMLFSNYRKNKQIKYYDALKHFSFYFNMLAGPKQE